MPTPMPRHRRRRPTAPAPPPPAVPLTLTSGPVPGLPLGPEPRLPGGLPQREAVELLAVLARLAEALLSSGSPVHDVVRSVLRAARGAELRGVQVDITYTAVTVCAVRDDGVPLTALRVIRSRDSGYARLSHLYALARAAGDGMPRQEVAARLSQVLAAPPERSAAVRWGATPLLAAAVAVIAGAGPALAVAAAMASAVVLLVREACVRVDLPPFFAQAAGAGAAVAVALALRELPQDLPGVGPLSPAVVVGPGLVVLLAGLSLVESGEDAIAGYYVTAGARLFETVVMTSGMVVGIAAALSIARHLGSSVSLQAEQGSAGAVVGFAAAAVISAAQGLSRDAGRRAVVLSSLVGGSAWVVQHGARGAGLGPVLSVGVAALVVGALAQALGPSLSSPPVVVSICGIVPMLPGLAIYRGIASVVSEKSAAGASELITAGGIALALAAGTTLGLWTTAPRSTRRWAGRGVRRRP